MPEATYPIKIQKINDINSIKKGSDATKIKTLTFMNNLNNQILSQKNFG